MMARDWTRHTGLRVAVGALAVSMVVVAWTLARAFRTEQVSIPPATALASLDRPSTGGVMPPADVQNAVENDLFSPGRTAPSAPYRLPGEDTADETPAEQPEKPVVLGTAVATDGRHFATVQLSNGTPQLVHVGDRIGGWVVRSIERGRIVLVSAAGARVDVTVPKSGT